MASPPHRGSPPTPKFVAIYTKLLQGVAASQLDPKGNEEQLFSDLLDLRVDCAFLGTRLQQLSKDECLGRVKPFLNSLFASCLLHASKSFYAEAKKGHALETLILASKYVLSKNLSGWEVMELVAGSISESDRVFNNFTSILNTIIGDGNAPPTTRHLAVRLGLAFVCSISQLSPGAYFLRQNLFPSVIEFVQSQEANGHILDAALFLAILANYHKSDAARMNPYLKRMKEFEDDEAMRKICRAVVPSLEAATSAYAQIYPTSSSSSITATLSSLLRPDMLLSRMRSNSSLPKATPPDQESQPIPEAVSLLPIYEFMAGNANFRRVLLSDLNDPTSKRPWIGAFLNLASWLLTNASSSSSARTMSYASLNLEVILVLVEDDDSIGVLSSKSAPTVQLCQQRQPKLQVGQPGRPLLCDILDCCNLWLRHNLHRRIAAHSYSKCIWICHRIVWYLQHERMRLDYHWKELWLSAIGLFSFMATKFDTLITTGGIGQLILDGLSFLEAAIACAETYLPTPNAVHELVYEIVRNSAILEKQQDILSSLEIPPHGEGALRYVVDVTSYYKEKISATGANLKDASDAMRIIVQEVELNGLYRPGNAAEQEPRLRAEEVLDFARYACGDALAGA